MKNNLELDSVSEDVDKKVRELLINHEIKILVVCMHGRSRSKAVAKLLRDKFGYDLTRSLGIQDPQISDSEKIERLNDADMVMAVESDVIGEVIFKLPEYVIKKITSRILLFPLTQKEHQALSFDLGMKYKRQEALNSIEDRLDEFGFLRNI